MYVLILILVLDYLRSDTPISSERLKYKLDDIAYKIDVEQKVKAGTERMWQVILQNSSSNDEKHQMQVEDKLAECNSKVSILAKAKQKYQTLYVEDDEDNDAEGCFPIYIFLSFFCPLISSFI